MSITHAAVAGPLIELTDYQAAHTIALSAGDIPNLSAVYDVAGLAAAAEAASDPSGSATTAQTNAEAYTDTAVTGLMTQAQVLARSLGA